MRKEEFLNQLRTGLSRLPREELEERLSFYSEMIDDRVEEGRSEDTAVSELGSVEEIVAQVAAETPLALLVRENVKPRRKLRVWEIVLLILGAPIWLSLLIAAFAVTLVLYLVLWVLVIAVYAVDLAFACAAVVCLVGSGFLVASGRVPSSLLTAGAGLFLAGLTILLFFAALGLSKAVVKLAKAGLKGLKRMLIGKERTNA